MLKSLQDIRARTFIPPTLPTLPALMRSAQVSEPLYGRCQLRLNTPLKCVHSPHITLSKLC